MQSTFVTKTIKQPTIVFVPCIPYDFYSTVKLEHTSVSNSVNVNRKAVLPFCPDASDKERLIRTLSDFLAACDTDTLNINDADRYPLMKNLLGGDLKTAWESLYKTFTPTDKINANFQEHVRAFTRNFLPPNAWLLQKTYMENTTKPYQMDCYETAGRLRLINNLSVFLPGSNGQSIMPNDIALKQSYYNLMPGAWQANSTAMDCVSTTSPTPWKTSSISWKLNVSKDQHTVALARSLARMLSFPPK
jgi:hypothetical protein